MAVFKGLRNIFSAAVLTVAGTVNAGPIGVATDWLDGNLYEVDFGANTATLIGNTGFSQVAGISFQPGTGTLFGIDTASDQLITINTTTGAGTAIGSLGVDLFEVGLAFDSAGNLFASDDNGSANLYSIDPLTGAASVIGSTGTTGVAGLSFSSGGTLFGLVDTGGDQLVTIDTTTGAATAVGSLGLSTNGGGIAFDPAGNLYGAFAFVNQGLTTIDFSTGVAAAPTNIGIDFSGLAFRPSVGQVPLPTTVALLALGLLGMRLRHKA